MKTDRELLELAAKAVGRKVCGFSEDYDELFIGDAFGKIGLWNPKDNGNDMVELVAKLKLSITIDGRDVHVSNEFGGVLATVCGDGESVKAQNILDCVLFAAAEIGEAME